MEYQVWGSQEEGPAYLLGTFSSMPDAEACVTEKEAIGYTCEIRTSGTEGK
jgi:hypothetical protein